MMQETAGFLDLFLQGASDAMLRLQPHAERLVAILATISVVLTFVLGALRKDFDPVGTLIGKILLIGVIVWFITSWPDLLGDLIEGAVFLGSAAGGRGDPAVVMQPLSVITWGWDFAGLCFRRVGDLSGPVATFRNFDVIVILTVCALVVAFAYLIMGVTIAVALVEFWIGSAVALILLPFAVFKPMAFIAQSTFGWVAGNAIRMLLLSTIVTLGSDSFDLMSLIDSAADEISADKAFAGTVIAVFLLLLNLSAQRMALGLINGAPQLGGSAVFAPAAGAVAGSVAAASGAKAGGKGVMSIMQAGGSLVSSGIRHGADRAFGTNLANRGGGGQGSGKTDTGKNKK